MASVASDAAPAQKLDHSPEEVDHLMALRHGVPHAPHAVLGFSDVLLSGIDGEVNDSQREDLEIIRASGMRLEYSSIARSISPSLLVASFVWTPNALTFERLSRGPQVRPASCGPTRELLGCTLPEGSCVAESTKPVLGRSILVLADFLATDHREATIALSLAPTDDHLAIEVTAEPSDRLSLGALPTPVEVLASEDATEIRDGHLR